MANRFQQWSPDAAVPDEGAPLAVTVRPSDATPAPSSAEPAGNRFAKFGAPEPEPAGRPLLGYGQQRGTSQTEDEINAISGGFVRDIPIIGPALDSGAKAAAAGIRSILPGGQDYASERKAVEDYAGVTKAENPGLALGGGVAGNVTALAPVGATALGARALGMGPGGLGSRVFSGAVGGGAIGGLDAAARGEDVGTGAGIGAGIGGAAPGLGAAVRRILSPARVAPERQALTQTLEREGVPLSAGDLTGSKAIRYAEDQLGNMPFVGGKATAIKDTQGQAYTAAALKRAGIDAPLATPDVLEGANKRLGSTFEVLSARNTLQYDPKLATDLGKMLHEYDRVLPSQQREVVNNLLQDIVFYRGQMPGEVYQATRSRLSRMSKNAMRNDPEYGGALRSMRNALDDAMERSLAGSPDAGVWELTRRQYGALKTIEKAAAGGGERGAQGYITPDALKGAVSAGDRGRYARGIGELAELARAGKGVLAALPNSGTAQRALVQGALGAGGGFIGSGGDPKAAALGLITPALLGRALLSRPVQGYLGSRAGTPAVQSAVTRGALGTGLAVQRERDPVRLDQIGER